MIVGTAGHIDHGKTALVRALTGVDTDRLPEEKARGISIELGFAPLDLGALGRASVVDVPGHAHFVRTMAAGASAIDVALLLVAADEGLRAQTEEHLRILSALGVPLAGVAITKIDRVAADDVARCVADMRATLAALSIPEPPFVPVSVVTGEGVERVRMLLADAARATPLRPPDDLFRLVVDRAFTVRGTGTVVTGAVRSGQLRVGARVRLLPSSRESRVRAIRMFDDVVDTAIAGERCALALSDVAAQDVPRGSAVVADACWRPTTRLVVRLDRPIDAPARERLAVHVAGADAIARVGRVSGCDDEHTARVALDRPVVARRGDRVLLRPGDRADAIVGGVVLDPLPERRTPAGDAGDTPGEWLVALARAAGRRGVAVATLPVRLGVAPAHAVALVHGAGLVTVGDRAVAEQVVRDVAHEIATRVAAWTRTHPLAPGMPRSQLRQEAGVGPSLADAALAWARADGILVPHDGVVALAATELPPADAAALARLLQIIRGGGLEPPSVHELRDAFGAPTDALLRYAARRGNLVPVESVRYYAADVLDALAVRLREVMVPGREYTPGELRDLVGVSRKYLIPLLEYCDRVGVTDRHSGGRVLSTVSSQ